MSILSKPEQKLGRRAGRQKESIRVVTAPGPALCQLPPACCDLAHMGLLRAVWGEPGIPERDTEQQRAPVAGKRADSRHDSLDIETLWLKWIIALLAFPKQEENVNKRSDRKQGNGFLFPLSPHQHHCPREHRARKFPELCCSYGTHSGKQADHLSAPLHLAC